jgi:hypothetical protein
VRQSDFAVLRLITNLNALDCRYVRADRVFRSVAPNAPSKADSVRRVKLRGMSAVLPIASELLDRSEATLRAKRRNPHSTKAVTSRFAFAVVDGTHRRRISVPPQEVSRSRPNYSVACSSGPFEGTMPDPSPITYRFKAHNKRGARLRIEAATMRAGIVVLAQLVLCGNALSATEYAVDGLAVGTQLNFGNAPYREYKCNPSDQFEGLIWCQKSRTEKERRRSSYTMAYSLLRSQDGRISYINRSQEPAFLNSKESELNIERYSRKFGDSRRPTDLPY